MNQNIILVDKWGFARAQIYRFEIRWLHDLNDKIVIVKVQNRFIYNWIQFSELHFTSSNYGYY